ncbi:uncharacterized protein LOC142518465 [Primulina tabacum]|uniref:uncharacterized protein LOC142518465 n=1 Tax=Primulina tabacum TaxID=48773 RepID=UPI003F595A95
MDGGLGLKNLKMWNRALLAKTLWKIHSKQDSLWIRWVNHVYSCFGGVWNWHWHTEQSGLIKRIIEIRDELICKYGSKETAAAQLDSWFHNKGGVSRAYEFFAQKNGNWPWKPLLSKHYILPKHRFVLWLLAHRKLLTRDRLGYLQDSKCVLCLQEDESNLHLFFQCRITILVWDELEDGLE